MNLSRYLDVVEIPEKNLAPAFVLEYEGFLDLDAIRAAFKLLGTKYPVLRARIIEKDDGYQLCVKSNSRMPDVNVYAAKPNALAEALGRPWDMSRALSRLDIIMDDRRGAVSFRVDHAVVDGPAVATMLSDLWRLYTEICDKGSANVTPGTRLPTSPYSLYEERWGAQAVHSEPSEFQLVPGRTVFHAVRLNVDETAQARKVALGSDNTLYSLICGAMLSALRGQDEIAGQARMRCISNVGLRERVAPPVGATETTVFATRHIGEVMVSPDDDALTIGRELRADLKSAVATKSLLPIDDYLTIPALSETIIDERLATMGASSGGTIDIPTPSVLSVADLSVHLPFLPVEPDKPGAFAFPGVAPLIVNGHMKVVCAFPDFLFSPSEIDQIVADFTSNLTLC